MMRLSALLVVVKELNERRLALLGSKNHDYSEDADCHSNFRDVSAICRILKVDLAAPYGAAVYHVVQKLHRLCKFIFGKGLDPEHESVEDTVIDMHNYIDLGYTLWRELTNERRNAGTSVPFQDREAGTGNVQDSLSGTRFIHVKE